MNLFPNPEPLGFLEYVEERYRALERRRAGKQFPWSADPVIANHFLGNVFRDDDRTSVEAREFIASLTEDLALKAALIFRWVNWVPTLVYLMGLNDWSVETLLEALARRSAAGDKVLGAQAYRINTPKGVWKLEGIAEIASRLANTSFAPETTARSTILRLFEASGTKNSFLCYQTALDLRWIYGPYQDENTWVLVGLGAWRGAERLLGKYKRASSWEERAALRYGGNPYYQNLDPPDWLLEVLIGLLPNMQQLLGSREVTLHEVEGCLCGWDKYCRIATGEGPGRRYRPRP